MKLSTKLGHCKYPSVCFDLHISEVQELMMQFVHHVINLCKKKATFLLHLA